MAADTLKPCPNGFIHPDGICEGDAFHTQYGECFQCGAYGEVEPVHVPALGEDWPMCVERIGCGIRFDVLVRARLGDTAEVDYGAMNEYEE